MKIKSLERNNFTTTGNTHTLKHSVSEKFHHLKSSVTHKFDKSALQVSLLYILSIASISSWIISLKILPFGDMFQFLLGAAVLSVNLLIFKYTKI